MYRAAPYSGRGGLPLRARILLRPVFAGLAGLALLQGPISAPARADRAISVQVENDFLGFLNGDLTDRYYSNGFSISLHRGGPDSSAFARRLGATLFPADPEDAGARVWETFGLHHSFFTPDNISDPDPQPLTHPYAGYLRASYDIIRRRGETIDLARLSLGVVGPAALAQTIQTAWHDVIDSARPEGGAHQLRNEPVLQILWQRKGPRLVLLDGTGRDGGGPFDLDLRPVASFSLGNAFINGALGLEARFGQGLGNDFGPSRPGPDGPSTGFPERRTDRISWYVFAGADIRAVGRNLFIEGNSFRDGPGRPVERFVHDTRAGVTLSVKDWAVSFSHVSRSGEFDTQQGRHTFGVLSVTKRF